MSDSNTDNLPEDPLSPTPEAVASESDAPPAEASPESRVAALEAEIAQMKDHVLRALADAENTRKRALKEREDASKYAVSSFAKDMIEIADNFSRALAAVPQEARDADPALKNLMDGIDAIERGLLKSLEKHGVKKIEPMGEMFNPHFHEVMFEAPMPGKPGGTIIQLVEPGYVLNDRLLRAAKVGVVKDDGTRKVDATA